VKAITICQPHAWAVIHPEMSGKRFENRTWPCRYRGPLLIHAGKSREWLEDDQDEDDPEDRIYEGCPANRDLVFGAIIGIVRMVGCLTSSQIEKRDGKVWGCANGPWCHEYAEARALTEPIPFRGAQGLWAVPQDVLEEIGRQLRTQEDR
jgi:hypothetical protein